MVQKLNMNLLTAIELEGLRRKLRNWDSRVDDIRSVRCSHTDLT